MDNTPWRLFIALELPPDVLEAIARLQADLGRALPARAARWVRSEGIHLTLKFLGDVPASRVEGLEAALRKAAAGHRFFDLAVQGLGCFPDLKRPRVLWLGVTGDLSRLRALYASVEKHITSLGFPAEERGFSPHLTLARSARDASRDEIAQIGQVAQNRDVGQIAAWRVDAVSLMRSQLKPDGAQYMEVAAVSLEDQPR